MPYSNRYKKQPNGCFLVFCRDGVTVFELITPMLDFIKQNRRLQTLEADFRDYDMLTKNTVEAQMDFIL